MKIDVGGGAIPEPGYRNLDPVHGLDKFKRRLQDLIPAAPATVEAMRASHVMEHIPAGAERINAMNEAWRVLVPGGVFTITVPLVVAHGQWVGNWQAFADPTHVSFWCLPESFEYFCQGPRKPDADYGISLWAPLDESDMEVRDGWEGVVRMRKPGA